MSAPARIRLVETASRVEVDGKRRRGGPEALRHDRLDSWKEIAAYLGRSVRTVQRWEREEGLPVRRHVHVTLASVFATRAEIDAWRGGREQSPKRLASVLALLVALLELRTDTAAPAKLRIAAVPARSRMTDQA